MISSMLRVKRVSEMYDKFLIHLEENGLRKPMPYISNTISVFTGRKMKDCHTVPYISNTITVFTGRKMKDCHTVP